MKLALLISQNLLNPGANAEDALELLHQDRPQLSLPGLEPPGHRLRWNDDATVHRRSSPPSLQGQLEMRNKRRLCHGHSHSMIE